MEDMGMNLAAGLMRYLLGLLGLPGSKDRTYLTYMSLSAKTLHVSG